MMICFIIQGQQCGVKPPQEPWNGEEPTNLVTDGREAKPGSWPWQVGQ